MTKQNLIMTTPFELLIDDLIFVIVKECKLPRETEKQLKLTAFAFLSDFQDNITTMLSTHPKFKAILSLIRALYSHPAVLEGNKGVNPDKNRNQTHPTIQYVGQKIAIAHRAPDGSYLFSSSCKDPLGLSVEGLPLVRVKPSTFPKYQMKYTSNMSFFTRMKRKYRPRPVKYLDQSAFSSFWPAKDSSTANLSHTESILLDKRKYKVYFENPDAPESPERAEAEVVTDEDVQEALEIASKHSPMNSLFERWQELQDKRMLRGTAVTQDEVDIALEIESKLIERLKAEKCGLQPVHVLKVEESGYRGVIY